MRKYNYITTEDVEKFRNLTAAASHDLGKDVSTVTADEVIKEGEKQAKGPVFIGDIIFYRRALNILGFVLFVAIVALSYSVYLGNGGTEGLVAVASGGIGAMAGLFAAQSK